MNRIAFYRKWLKYQKVNLLLAAKNAFARHLKIDFDPGNIKGMMAVLSAVRMICECVENRANKVGRNRNIQHRLFTCYSNIACEVMGFVLSTLSDCSVLDGTLLVMWKMPSVLWWKTL